MTKADSEKDKCLSQQNLALMEQQARELKRDGSYTAALQLRLQLERLYDGSGATVSRQCINLNYIAFLSACIQDYYQAEGAARKCLGLHRSACSTPREKHATYRMMLAFVLAEEGKFEEAAVHGDEAVTLFADLHGNDSPFVDSCKRHVQRIQNKESGFYLDREQHQPGKPTSPTGHGQENPRSPGFPAGREGRIRRES